MLIEVATQHNETNHLSAYPFWCQPIISEEYQDDRSGDVDESPARVTISQEICRCQPARFAVVRLESDVGGRRSDRSTGLVGGSFVRNTARRCFATNGPNEQVVKSRSFLDAQRGEQTIFDGFESQVRGGERLFAFR